MVLALPVQRRRQAKELQDNPQKDAAQDNQADHNSTDNNCNQKDKATWGSGDGKAQSRRQQGQQHGELEYAKCVYLTINQKPLRILPDRKQESCQNFQ